MNYLPPKELSNAFIDIGKKKAGNIASQLFILALLAGVFIGFASHLATTVATGWEIDGVSAFWGLKKFFVGSVFSVGLMLVIIAGSELWTGNCLLSIALLNKDISLWQLMRNWLIVYTGNLVGSIFLAWMIAMMSGLTAGDVGGTAINIAYTKVTMGGEMHNIWCFFRGIGCNWLVCLAVMMAVAAKDIGGKVWAIFFPIMAFVTSGFEHAIANMYFIPAGIFSKCYADAVTASGKNLTELSALNWQTFFTQNLFMVTLGNLVGGAILCGAVYWWVYVRQPATPKTP